MNSQEAKKLEKRVLELLESEIKGKSVVIGVSGGPDSVFLLQILSLSSAKITAAHLNHQLREQESEKDAEFVQKLCEKLETPCETTRKDIKKLAKSRKGGLEETGRMQRYKFFKKVAKATDSSHILTAHHADDNLETILQNLSRGCGLEGLSGISITEKIAPDLTLFRPLLDIPKSEIIAYLKFKKISFRLDKSNQDTEFTRNFIRQEIIPEFQKLNPNLVKTVTRNSTNFREISDFLDQKAQDWIKKNSLNSSHTRFPTTKFRNLHPALQKQILRSLHQLHHNSTQNLETTHITEALTLIHNNIGNKKKKMGKLAIFLRNNIINLQSQKS